MVDWSKRAEEGIMARNSFCEWNVFLISTMQKESESRAKLLALLVMWASIRLMIVKVIGFDHGITCSGICRGSSSTLCVRKRQIRVIHYLRLSIEELKRATDGL